MGGWRIQCLVNLIVRIVAYAQSLAQMQRERFTAPTLQERLLGRYAEQLDRQASKAIRARYAAALRRGSGQVPMFMLPCGDLPDVPGLDGMSSLWEWHFEAAMTPQYEARIARRCARTQTGPIVVMTPSVSYADDDDAFVARLLTWTPADQGSPVVHRLDWTVACKYCERRAVACTHTVRPPQHFQSSKGDNK